MKKTFNQTMPCAVRLAALLLVPAVCVAFSGCSAVPGSSGSSAAEPSPSPAAAEPAAKPDLPSLLFYRRARHAALPGWGRHLSFLCLWI